MDLNGDQPPFWSQPTTSMHRRRSSAPLLTLPILIVILPIIALLLLFLIIPPFLTLTSQIFRPFSTVKRGWDSLNVILVLFAILCGVFARRNDDGSTPADNANNVSNVPSDVLDANLSNPQHWFDDDRYPTTKVYDRPISVSRTGSSRLRRSSSSYPDLRQDSLWETGDERFRFFDDFDIRRSHRSPDKNAHQLRRTRSDFEEFSEAKVIPVDTFVLRPSPAPPPKSPPPPPPPPPPVVRHRPRRTYQTVGREDRNFESDVGVIKVESPQVPPAPPPPPPQRAPPPPPPPPVRLEQKYVKLERRKSNATKEIRMVLAHLYNQRKKIKRKHRTKNTEEYSKPAHSPPEPPQYSRIPPQSPPPPPPPLPPHPSSVFQNLFKKSSKSKKVHSVPPPAPPPPPPPRSSKRKSQAPPPPPPPAPPRQPSRRRNTATSGKPPLPVRATNSYNDNLQSGNQSPLIPVPPPPPPFKMPEFRFVARGDFVSIHSGKNSRCSSPALGEVDNDILSTKESTAEKVNVMDGGDEVGSVFCPSPDVNVKADTFIARLRDGWRLEKMNSLREKQNMGPSPSPI